MRAIDKKYTENYSHPAVDKTHTENDSHPAAGGDCIVIEIQASLALRNEAHRTILCLLVKQQQVGGCQIIILPLKEHH